MRAFNILVALEGGPIFRSTSESNFSPNFVKCELGVQRSYHEKIYVIASAQIFQTE